MNPDTDRDESKKKGGPGAPPASPYGPQPHGVDEAAGGADSSPYENEPTGERRQKAEDDRRNNRSAGPEDTNQST